MSFKFVNNEDSGYNLIFKYEEGKRHKLRMLANDCVSMLVYNVPKVTIRDPESNSDEVLRGYKTFLCAFEGETRGNYRYGLDTMEDPLWIHLQDRDKYARDKDGNLDTTKPIHFRKSVQNIIPVFNRDKNRVELLRSGNMLFKKLHSIIQANGDPTGYDVVTWKTGTGFNTKYNIEPVVKSDDFEFTDKIRKEMADLMEWVEKSLYPETKEDVMKYIVGDDSAPTDRQIENTRFAGAIDTTYEESDDSDMESSADDTDRNGIINEIVAIIDSDSKKYEDKVVADVITRITGETAIDLSKLSLDKLNTIKDELASI